MNYLGITLRTAEWLLANTGYLISFKKDLLLVVNEKALSNGVITAGTLRLTCSEDNLICIWNTDYLSGTDTEEWGFIRLRGEFGILNEIDIYNEVLERCLYLITLRLQGYNFPDDRYIHRNPKENLHTCLAGRGEAWQSSIAWYDDKVVTSKGRFHSVLIVGPSKIVGPSNRPDFSQILGALEKIKSLMPKLLDFSNDLLTKARLRPLLDSKHFDVFKPKLSPESGDLPIGDKELEKNKINEDVRFLSTSWTYEEWTNPESPLTPLQKEIINSDIILKQPLRIIGSAGTGKSLLMQLLVMKRLRCAESDNSQLSIFYIVHNSEMKNTIMEKFRSLGAGNYINQNYPQKLIIKTLFEYACEELRLDDTMIMDKDATQTKTFQRYIVAECIDELFKEHPEYCFKSDLLKKVSENHELRDVFSDIITNEIGIGIKGRDLSNDRLKYIDSERPFTRFHGILNRSEREFVFDIFIKYNNKVNKENSLLDSDDIAISFLGFLKTPLWNLRRKKLAFDFVFIDETQLFNQNERQIFRFLTKSFETYLPLVIALDEAQEIRGSSNAGFGMLGIEHLANETLPNVHRCTEEILKLAFFVIQRTTDLFGSDFPDFTSTTNTLVNPKSGITSKPTLVVRNDHSLGHVIKKEISTLRKKDLRQIAVIIHPDRYFKEIVNILKEEKENLIIAEKRGELIDPKKPAIYISRPDLIGGQEFDAVIVVGLEYGVTPPLINGHAGLSEALEQQTLREIYLSFTRAKYKLLVINNRNSSPSGILQQAIEEGIISVE